MISIEKSLKTYPNHPTRAFLLELEDVLGKNGLNALLRIAGLQEWIDTYPAENFERDVDLSELGYVKHLTFSFDSNIKNDFGILIPTYVCIDNIEGELESLD